MAQKLGGRVVGYVTIVVGSNKGRRNNKVERRSRFISSSLSPIWLLRSSGLHGKVGLYSASKRCRRNGNIVTGYGRYDVTNRPIVYQ